QRPVLRQELDVGEAAGILLEIQSAITALRELAPHALAHRPHLVAQGLAPDRMAQRLETSALELRAECGGAGDRTRMQQRLMLPGPRFMALVLGEGIDLRDEQSAFTARPQAYVHLIEAACRRVHGEKMHQPLGEAHEEQGIVDRPYGGPGSARAVRLLALAARIVQKHEVEIR